MLPSDQALPGTDNRIGASCVLFGVAIAAALLFALGPARPNAAYGLFGFGQRPAANTAAAKRVPGTDNVKIVDAAPRAAPCGEQTWPYIEPRCLTRAVEANTQPATPATDPNAPSPSAAIVPVPEPRPWSAAFAESDRRDGIVSAPAGQSAAMPASEAPAVQPAEPAAQTNLDEPEQAAENPRAETPRSEKRRARRYDRPFVSPLRAMRHLPIFGQLF